MSEPSNSEIMEKLGNIESKFDVRLKDILEQVKYTNGRVTKLERWREKLDIIADYRKEEIRDGQVEKVVDWQKIILAIFGLLATALAIIGGLASR